MKFDVIKPRRMFKIELTEPELVVLRGACINDGRRCDNRTLEQAYNRFIRLTAGTDCGSLYVNDAEAFNE